MFGVAKLLSDSLAVLLAMQNSPKSNGNESIKITGLYRYAVKGLSGDSLERIPSLQPGDTFPDDRRYALLFHRPSEEEEGGREGEEEKKKVLFDSDKPEWLHKQNFLCAFTDPKLMASYQSSYQIISDDDSPTSTDTSQRLLTITDCHPNTPATLLGPLDLATPEGRGALGSFFSQQSEKDVVCVTASSAQHSHQFGNTSSGVKKRSGDTRTIHIINAETVRQVSERIGVRLQPTRFRPNIVLEGLEPWKEFDWVDEQTQLRIGNGDGGEDGKSLVMTAIQRTVRCDGVSIDPSMEMEMEKKGDGGDGDMEWTTELDIPGLLNRHFPQYGPYLGVYAVVEEAGSIQIGDQVEPL